MPHPVKNKTKKVYRRKGNRFVTFSTLSPTPSNVSSLSAAKANSVKTSPAMSPITNVGYLGIEPNGELHQSQQDFASASCAQKQVLAGTMSARELRSLKSAVTSASSSGASPRASRQSFRPRRPHMLSFQSLMSAR